MCRSRYLWHPFTHCGKEHCDGVCQERSPQARDRCADRSAEEEAKRKGGEDAICRNEVLPRLSRGSWSADWELDCNQMLDSLGLHSKKRVLDLGCETLFFETSTQGTQPQSYPRLLTIACTRQQFTTTALRPDHVFIALECSAIAALSKQMKIVTDQDHSYNEGMARRS